jgi:hypothetical protein
LSPNIKFGIAAANTLLNTLAVLVLTSVLASGESFPPTAITAPEVKQMLEDRGALLVHVLSKIEYEVQRIPGSINIPINEVAGSTRLPEDRARTLIFYCMGQR